MIAVLSMLIATGIAFIIGSFWYDWSDRKHRCSDSNCERCNDHH